MLLFIKPLDRNPDVLVLVKSKRAPVFIDWDKPATLPYDRFLGPSTVWAK